MISQHDGRLLVQGSITIANVKSELESGLVLLTRDALTVDLAGVEEADSSALSMLLEWQRAVRRNGHSLHYVNMPANMKSLAQLYGVEDLIPQA